MSTTETNWESFEQKISAAGTIDELNAVDQELFSRKSGAMTKAMGGLKDLPELDKKNAAKDLNIWKKKLTEQIDAKHKEIQGSGDNEIGRAHV